MTQEEKDLLFKELTSRFPYGVKILEGNVIIETLERIEKVSETDYVVNRVGDGTDGFGFEISDVKLYLRPISSMTEKEMDTLFDILKIDKRGDGESWIKINDLLGIEFFIPEGVWVEDMIKAYDYLYSIHIDFRGLIGAGLALKAPETMYTRFGDMKTVIGTIEHKDRL